MTARLLQKFGPHYILLMMLVTRGFASLAGGMCIYYVNLTFELPPEARRHFELAACAVILLAVILTVVMALWETRDLRQVLHRLRRGGAIEPELAARAGEQSVLFPGRHARHEAILDPLITIVPICAIVRFADGAPFEVLLQIFIAGCLGLTAIILATFFISEHWLIPVTRCLLANGIPVRFDELPPSRLQRRMLVSFASIILATALMIGALANQRAQEIIRQPDQQKEAVASLRRHTAFITATAVIVGIAFSQLLANSVSKRVGTLVEAMRRVQAGSFSQRVEPTGMDEIDVLARQFNAMVSQLAQNDQTIRDLNLTLEHKVKTRTRQLSQSKQTLQRSLRKLQEYDQLKTDFFSNISHELRTPLTMILAPLEQVLDEYSPVLPLETTSHLQIMQINAFRLLKLINQLLEFSKLEAGRAEIRPTAVDLNALAEDLTDAARPLAVQREISLFLDLDRDLPHCAADAEKIETVLNNLISNALKFTPTGGRVDVRTRLLDGRIEVSVSDTGIGIAPEDYDRCFERFVQLDGSTSREFAGTGLGLALAKELIELHGGSIHVTSEPARGSRFWFELPVKTAAESAVVLAKPTARSRLARQQRFADLATCSVELRVSTPHPADAPCVLIVDDTPEMLQLLQRLLGEQYRVVCAADGEEGTRVALAESPDLIISDVMMPHVDGYEFCRRIRANPGTMQIPFVLLTAKAGMQMKLEGLDCGADDYLIKPFDAEELKARVRSLLRVRRLNRELDRRNGDLERTLQELRSTQMQLVHSEKMNSVGQLVAGLAHEINNSINAVYNGIQPLNARSQRLRLLVSKALEAPAACDSALQSEIDAAFRKISLLAEVIEHGASRTARIVSDLKTFSHPGSEAVESFDLHASLDVCLNLLANQIRDRIRVLRNYGDDVGLITGPSGQLNQVFMNILTNAQQAIPREGEIAITTRREGNGVVISIRDTGEGIPEAIRTRIFDPFFTTKAPGVGTGLGLSISYGIITGLGGTIECDSSPGEGTEFRLFLPDCEPARAGQRIAIDAHAEGVLELTTAGVF